MQTSRNRVPAQTPPEINREIQREIDAHVYYYRQHSEEIPERLKALDEEWDIERAIEANAAALGFIGVVLGATGSRRWLAYQHWSRRSCSNMRSRDGAHPSRFSED